MAFQALDAARFMLTNGFKSQRVVKIFKNRFFTIGNL